MSREEVLLVGDKDLGIPSALFGSNVNVVTLNSDFGNFEDLYKRYKEKKFKNAVISNIEDFKNKDNIIRFRALIRDRDSKTKIYSIVKENEKKSAKQEYGLYYATETKEIDYKGNLWAKYSPVPFRMDLHQKREDDWQDRLGRYNRNTLSLFGENYVNLRKKVKENSEKISNLDTDTKSILNKINLHNGRISILEVNSKEFKDRITQFELDIRSNSWDIDDLKKTCCEKKTPTVTKQDELADNTGFPSKEEDAESSSEEDGTESSSGEDDSESSSDEENAESDEEEYAEDPSSNEEIERRASEEQQELQRKIEKAPDCEPTFFCDQTSYNIPTNLPCKAKYNSKNVVLEEKDDVETYCKTIYNTNINIMDEVERTMEKETPNNQNIRFEDVLPEENEEVVVKRDGYQIIPGKFGMNLFISRLRSAGFSFQIPKDVSKSFEINNPIGIKKMGVLLEGLWGVLFQDNFKRLAHRGSMPDIYFGKSNTEDKYCAQNVLLQVFFQDRLFFSEEDQDKEEKKMKELIDSEIEKSDKECNFAALLGALETILKSQYKKMLHYNQENADKKKQEEILEEIIPKLLKEGITEKNNKVRNIIYTNNEQGNFSNLLFLDDGLYGNGPTIYNLDSSLPEEKKGKPISTKKAFELLKMSKEFIVVYEKRDVTKELEDFVKFIYEMYPNREDLENLKNRLSQMLGISKQKVEAIIKKPQELQEELRVNLYDGLGLGFGTGDVNWGNLGEKIKEELDTSSSVTNRILTNAEKWMIDIVIIGMLIALLNVVNFLTMSTQQPEVYPDHFSNPGASALKAVHNSSFVQNITRVVLRIMPNLSNISIPRQEMIDMFMDYLNHSGLVSETNSANQNSTNVSRFFNSDNVQQVANIFSGNGEFSVRLRSAITVMVNTLGDTYMELYTRYLEYVNGNPVLTQVGMQMEEPREVMQKENSPDDTFNGKATAAERRDAYIKAFFYIGLAAVFPKRANAPNS